MKNLIPALLLCTLLFTACGDDDAMPVDCIDAAYGTAFIIEADQTYCFDGLELEVVALNNEYCGCDVVCIWEGQMTIDMIWTYDDGMIVTYHHNAAGTVISNDQLPDSVTVEAPSEGIVFESDCSDSIPNPTILSAEITVDR